MLKTARVIISIIIILPLVIIIASSIATTLFNQSVAKEVKELFGRNPAGKTEIVQKADLEGLPPCVQKWLEHSQIIGKERIRTVRLRQKVLMRLKEDGPWVAAEAEQYFTVDKPGFVWKAKTKMAPLIYVSVRDKYFEGRGQMLIKLLSFIPLGNAKGPEMDQGALLRYLAEIQWFPSAALSSYIKWEEIDSNTARATMSYGGVTASGIFKFNDKGDIISFDTKRYREVNGKFILTDWGGLNKAYREFNGIIIPSKTDVIWKLKTGDFDWFKCEIMEIEYNKPDMY